MQNSPREVAKLINESKLKMCCNSLELISQNVLCCSGSLFFFSVRSCRMLRTMTHHTVTHRAFLCIVISSLISKKEVNKWGGEITKYVKMTLYIKKKKLIQQTVLHKLPVLWLQFDRVCQQPSTTVRHLWAES